MLSDSEFVTRTTQIIAGVSFRHNGRQRCLRQQKIIKPKSFQGIDTPELFYYPGRTRCNFSCVLGGYCCFHGLITTQTFRRALTASVDSCAEIRSAPFSGVTNSVCQSWEEGAGKRRSECMLDGVGLGSESRNWKSCCGHPAIHSVTQFLFAAWTDRMAKH